MYLTWTEWKIRRDNPITESKGQQPNYSFDNWLKMTKSFGDEVSSFVGQAKEKDQEMDKEIKKKKDTEKQDDDAEKKKKETAWKRLQTIAKERREEAEKKDSKESDKSQASR